MRISRPVFDASAFLVVLCMFLIASYYYVTSPARSATPVVVTTDPPAAEEPEPMPHTARWIVLTTIDPPTPQARALCRLTDWTTVIIADNKTDVRAWTDVGPACHVLLLEAQQALGYRITPLIPLNSYARKSIGYLYAIQRGARVIYDTDPDNGALGGRIRLFQDGAPFARLTGSIANPYAHFGRSEFWPRGYPLSEINASRTPTYLGCPCDAPRLAHGRVPPVQQGLVALDADVDAILRLTQTQHVGNMHFLSDRVPVALARGTYSCTNSQNTIWLERAFFSLLLPITPSIRVTDIWRGYVSQRLVHDVGDETLFLPPTAEQVRMPHSYYSDFLLELDLYTRVPELLNVLTAYDTTTPLPGRFVELVQRLADAKLVGGADVALAEAWIADLADLGYAFPALDATPTPVPYDAGRGCAPSPFPPGKRVAVFVRTFSEPKHMDEFWRLVRSLELFWPMHHYTFVVVLDDETAADHAFGAAIQQRLPAALVRYEAPHRAYKTGHARQQYSMFVADTHVPPDTDFVAILDTDVLLTTVVTPELLFDEQWRPRVKALIDRRDPAVNGFWAGIPANTKQWLLLPEVLRGMGYFPVIVRCEDLAFIRQHLEFIHGFPFRDLFTALTPTSGFSQFNIWFNLLYYTRRDAYRWHFHLVDGPVVPKNRTHPGAISAASCRQLLATSDTAPVVSGALHVPYMSKVLGSADPWRHAADGLAPAATIRAALFDYDGAQWTWDDRALAAQYAHYGDMAHMGYRFSPAQLAASGRPSAIGTPVSVVFIHGTMDKTRAWLAYPEHARLVTLAAPNFIFLSTSTELDVPVGLPAPLHPCPVAPQANRSTVPWVYSLAVCFQWLIETSGLVRNASFLFIEHDVIVRDAHTFLAHLAALAGADAHAHAITTLQGERFWRRTCALDGGQWWCARRYKRPPINGVALYSEPAFRAHGLLALIPKGLVLGGDENFDNVLYYQLLARGLDGFDQAVATVDEPLMCLAPTGRETVIGQLLVEFPSCLAWHLTSYKRTWPHLDDLIVMFNTQGAR